MALKQLSNKVTVLIKKYRYVAIILVIGIILMCLPERERTNDSAGEISENTESIQLTPDLNEQLSDVLCQIKGAGNVHVLLTLSKGEETVYQTDSHISKASDNTSTQIETVIVSGSERNQSGLIKQVNPATYMGAIVVCQGADSPGVRLAIVEAVSKVTGLGADRISVLKMK